MAGGFRVDLTALKEASDGVNRTLSQLARHKVDTLEESEAAIGHSRLAGSVSDFCDRWQLGVTNLAKDGKAIAAQLMHCVQAYEKVDQGEHDRFNGMLQRSSGPDPAAH